MWQDELAKKIVASRGKNLVVATGVTPSGPIHLGNLKEIMVGYLIARALKKQGAKVRFILLVDDFDPLRKVYPFLPRTFEKYVGAPLSQIPFHKNCPQSYAQHFLSPFYKSLKKLGVRTEIFSVTKLYQKGAYTMVIKKILENREKVIKILEKVSGRKIEKNWSPFMPLCEKCGKLTTTKVTGYDLKNNKVFYESQSGFKGVADFSRGQGKLTFRLQWPSSWKIFDVNVEGFGKDHASSGGTYDSSSEIAKEIFGIKPPFPIPFEWVYVRGKGKMAGSTGVGFTPEEMLEIMPQKTLIHFYERTKPNRHFDFDIGEDVPSLWNESDGLSGIPFEHLVMVSQSASDFSDVLESLRRTGYENKLKGKNEKLKTEIMYVRNWLSKYAPERYKFEVQKTVPKIKLSKIQKEFLSNILQTFVSKKLTGEKLHQEIHKIKNNMNVSPRDAFSAIYLSFLGKDSGPQAGWFLASLDRDLVIKRLKEII